MLYVIDKSYSYNSLQSRILRFRLINCYFKVCLCFVLVYAKALNSFLLLIFTSLASISHFLLFLLVLTLLMTVNPFVLLFTTLNSSPPLSPSPSFSLSLSLSEFYTGVLFWLNFRVCVSGMWIVKYISLLPCFKTLYIIRFVYIALIT